MDTKPDRHTMKHATFNPNQPKAVIGSIDEIPSFRDECEEVEFWDTHTLSDELWASLPPVPDHELPPDRPRTPLDDPGDIVIPVAIPKDRWQALRRRAKACEVSVPVLIRGWVVDQLAK